MRITHRIRMTWGAFLLGVVVLGNAAAAFSNGDQPLPNNVHPAVAEAIRTTTEERVTLILHREHGDRSAERNVTAVGARVTASWPFINAFAVDVPVKAVRSLAAVHGIRMIFRDHPVQSDTTTTSAVDTSQLLNTYNYAVNTDRVWSQGYKGEGVTVAVIDSGISPTADSSLNDLAGRTVESVNFNNTSSTADDGYGHGTHVAGIIGGDGRADGGKYIGIAPGVNLVNVKFSNEKGKASEKDLINALQWVYDNHARLNIRVVNISSNTAGQLHYTESPAAAAVEKLWLSGIVVVVSVGNRGGNICAPCYPPASDPYVISVGATDDNGTASLDDDVTKAWSSSGLTLDAHVKPDIMAPGARIVSYLPKGTIRTKYAQYAVGQHYFRLEGTSMAAPIVSGVVALMLQVKPDLTPDQVKWILKNTARSYVNQPAATPGIVTADAAVFYSGAIGSENQVLTPSPMLTSGTSSSDSNTLWSNTNSDTLLPEE